MKSTLFHIPHELFGLPVFGIGWMLGIWVIVVVVYAWLSHRKTGGFNEFKEATTFWLLSGAMIVFVAPMMEEKFQLADQSVFVAGLPIRGYGVLMLLGATCGFAITYKRAERLGINLDTLMSFALWAFMGGIAGARLFFVVQKWEEFSGNTLSEKLFNALQITEGGLVVYGGMIGGLVVGGLWCMVKGIPKLAMADLITPGFLIGASLGRIGCFLHGCCFGGICTTDLPQVQFPKASPAYMNQIANGSLIGWTLEPAAEESDSEAMPSQLVTGIRGGSLAADLPYRVGDELPPFGYDLRPHATAESIGSPPEPYVVLYDQRGDRSLSPLPDASLPVHPSQIYSAVNAFLLCSLLYFLWPFPKRDGFIFAAGLALYAVSRSIEEIIRSDELGQFGTSLTISQWVSVVGFIVATTIVIVQVLRAKNRWRFAT